MRKWAILLKLNLFQFVYHNFLNKRVIRDKACYILPIKGSVIEFDKTAKLILHANLCLNHNKLRRSRAEVYLRLRKNAEMVVNGNVSMYYGTTIEVHKDANLSIGRCSLNTGAVVICAYKMQIGNGVLISRLVHIMDSDHHDILDESGTKTNTPKEVIIDDHVWIGIKSTILRGVKIGEGAVVSANSTVINRIKPHTLVSGSPARVFSEVRWRI